MSSAAPPRVQALAKTPELNKFCELLERFLETGEGEDELPGRAAALATEAKQLALPPEHILYAMRVARCRGDHGRSDDERSRVESRRYAAAIAVLLRHYFGVAEEDIEPVGDIARARTSDERAFRAEVTVREVADPMLGVIWTVHLVREGYTWDPEIEMRRRDWLSCSATGERRFIAPAPEDWLDWTDAELLAAIATAPLDQRKDC